MYKVIIECMYKVIIQTIMYIYIYISASTNTVSMKHTNMNIDLKKYFTLITMRNNKFLFLLNNYK